MTKYLVDTSVWSESLRRKKNSIHSTETIIRKIIDNEDEIILIGIILQEILTGISDKNLYIEIKTILEDFSYLEPTKEDYIFATKLNQKCRSKGITAGTIDFLISSIAIQHKLTLVTLDKDFYNISKCSDLKILKFE